MQNAKTGRIFDIEIPEIFGRSKAPACAGAYIIFHFRAT